MAKKAENGFTIIELLVAIAVVGILVPTLVGFVNSLNRINDRAHDLAIINSLAENKVESLRSMGFTALNDGSTDFSSQLPPTIGSPKTASYSVVSENSSIKRIDIEITYNDHGDNKTMTYRTYVGEIGVGQY